MLTQTPEQQRDLGVTLRTMREAAGLSLRALARDVGVTHTTLSRLEHGTRIVSAETLDAITQALADHANRDGDAA